MTLSNLQQYGHAFQIKVISSLLTHKDFLINIHDIISDEYWDNQAHKWIIKEILKYYEKFHTTPSMDVLKVEMKKLENEVLKISIKEQLRDAYKSSDEDLEYVHLPQSVIKLVQDNWKRDLKGPDNNSIWK